MSILMGGVKLDTVRKTATKDGVYTVLVQGDLVDEMAEFLKEKLSELLNSSVPLISRHYSTWWRRIDRWNKEVASSNFIT